MVRLGWFGPHTHRLALRTRPGAGATKLNLARRDLQVNTGDTGYIRVQVKREEQEAKKS